MIPCPFCGVSTTIVADSNWNDTHKTVKRKRFCIGCFYEWYTLEIDADQVDFLSSLSERNFPKPDSKNE